METLVRTLGKVKQTLFNNNFDQIVDEYKQKAIRMGYKGELFFKKEHNNIIILVSVKDKKINK